MNYTIEAVEQIRARRFALSVRLNELHAAAVKASGARPFKKGARVFIVSVGHTYGPADSVQVIGREVTLTSLGKRQGTATHVADGKNILTQITRSHTLLVATREEVQAYADLAGPVAAEESHLGSAYCEAFAILGSFRAYLAPREAKVDAELAAADAKRYEVVFR